MTKYIHKKTGAIVTLIEINEKSRMVIVQDDSTNDYKSFTIGTLKRWYKKLEVLEVPIVVPEEPQVLVEAETVPEKKRRSRTVNPDVERLLNAVFSLSKNIGADVKEGNGKFAAVRKDSRQFCKVMWGNTSVKLFFRSDSVLDIAKPDIEYESYNLSHVYIFTKHDDTSVQKMSDLLTFAYKDTTVKAKKSKKAEKEEK